MSTALRHIFYFFVSFYAACTWQAELMCRSDCKHILTRTKNESATSTEGIFYGGVERGNKKQKSPDRQRNIC